MLIMDVRKAFKFNEYRLTFMTIYEEAVNTDSLETFREDLEMVRDFIFRDCSDIKISYYRNLKIEDMHRLLSCSSDIGAFNRNLEEIDEILKFRGCSEEGILFLFDSKEDFEKNMYSKLISEGRIELANKIKSISKPLSDTGLYFVAI